MLAAAEIIGRCASTGRFRGPAFVASQSPDTMPGSGDPEHEGALLRDAIEAAARGLSELASGVDRDVAAIVDFQVEILRDPELAGEVFARIEAGEGAANAWVAAMDHYIAGFRASDDETVRARAADLTDIRERILSGLAGRPLSDFPAGSVYVGADMMPSQFLMHDWSQGGAIVLSQGSSTSHVALLARARGIPMVVATGPNGIAPDIALLVEAESGRIFVKPRLLGDFVDNREPAAIVPLHGPAETRLPDGSIATAWVTVNDVSELARVDPRSIQGVGLLRSEFLVRSVQDLSDEDRQFALYRQVVEWASGRTVTIRLFDLGGDKQLPGLASSGGISGSMLGRRGVRFLLYRPEILRVQLRAIIRISALGPVRVLVPMVTVPDEIDTVRKIAAEEVEVIAARGEYFAMPEIGMMVEVPAAALMLDRFATADFFSLGTNDLGQYLAAAAREDETFSPLIEASAPALERLIGMAVTQAHAISRPIAICGDLAGEKNRIPMLLGSGLRAFSVVPGRLTDLWSALNEVG